MKAVWLLSLLCLAAWAAASFALPSGESDEDLVSGLKDAIDDKVKSALADATGEEEEAAEDAADVDSDSDEVVAEEEEAEEVDEEEETSSSSRKRKLAIAKRKSTRALSRRLHAVLVLAAKACGGVKDLKCVHAAVLKRKTSDEDGEVLEALLVGGAAGLKLECRSASSRKRSFGRLASSKRDLSDALQLKIKRILLVLKASEKTCVAKETGAENVKKCVLVQTVSVLTSKHERRMAFALVVGLVEGYKAHCSA